MMKETIQNKIFPIVCESVNLAIAAHNGILLHDAMPANIASNRKKEKLCVSMSRSFAVVIMRDMYGCSFPFISGVIRAHINSVLRMARKCRYYIKTDPMYSEAYETMKRRIKESWHE